MISKQESCGIRAPCSAISEGKVIIVSGARSVAAKNLQRFTGKSVVRAAFEDKTLLDEFDGYKDYTQQLPYRLTPQIL